MLDHLGVHLRPGERVVTAHLKEHAHVSRVRQVEREQVPYDEYLDVQQQHRPARTFAGDHHRALVVDVRNMFRFGLDGTFSSCGYDTCNNVTIRAAAAAQEHSTYLNQATTLFSYFEVISLMSMKSAS